MIVTAALIWYDELPSDLMRCVRALGDVADRIVAVDGAYVRYPDAQITSPAEQVQAIRDAAADVKIEAKIYIPNRLWLGQVEKRSFVLQKASINTDWIAVLDTDWIVHGDREAVRAELEAYRPHRVEVVRVPFYTPLGEGAYGTEWHRQSADTHVSMPHFYRPLPGLHVEKQHWRYRAKKGHRDVWMWGGRKGAVDTLKHYPLQAEYLIEHRFLFRDEKHILDGRAFCNDRAMVFKLTGQEDHIEGLPAPVFDYETVPNG